MLSNARHQITIRNGLYLAETKFLDGVDAYNRHVMVLCDGTMRGAVDFIIQSEATPVRGKASRARSRGHLVEQLVSAVAAALGKSCARHDTPSLPTYLPPAA
jgi:hypothetical protein